MSSAQFRTVHGILILAALLSPATPALAQSVADSYHAQLGRLSGTGMLERWSALNHFSYELENGVYGWIERGCGDCHIGADWNPVQEQKFPNCLLCHSMGENLFEVTLDACLGCHVRDSVYRGDLFTANADVHVAAGFACQSCHSRVVDKRSDHQFLKGTAIDTTDPNLEGSLSCTRFCHSREPHQGGPNGGKLNQHTDKVACETCHTGPRPAPALALRDWTVFAPDGVEHSETKSAGWMPAYKWYDNTGPGVAGRYEQPILDTAERRDAAGSRIYPFNAVTVRWFVKEPDSMIDDVIVISEVRAADDNGDGLTTVDEMQLRYAGATLLERVLNLSISHSVRPAAEAFDCGDCHGRTAWLLDWIALGYAGDPRAGPGPWTRKPR